MVETVHLTTESRARAFALRFPTSHGPQALTRTCFSFLSRCAKLTGTLSVWATMSAGVRASHCVNGMSSTLSDL